MDRVQAASFMALDRPLLGQMAIATVLVGSVATLSSAGIAVPVSTVGFANGWDDRAHAASGFAAEPVAFAQPAAPRAMALGLSLSPVLHDGMATPRAANHVIERTVLIAKVRPIRIEPAPPPRLVVARTPRIVSTPMPAELPLPPAEADVAALVVQPVPDGLANVASASLAETAPVPLAVDAMPGVQPLPVTEAPPLRLINPPELRGFDLARVSAPAKSVPATSVPAGFARPPVKSKASGKLEALGKKDTVVGDAVFHQVSVSIAGSEGKTIDVRIGTDMKPSIKVGDLLGLVSDRMDPDSAARFAAASSAGEYVSLATLRAAGFDVAYNAGADSISISAAQ
jgi:hypothetical protein